MALATVEGYKVSIKFQFTVDGEIFIVGNLEEVKAALSTWANGDAPLCGFSNITSVDSHHLFMTLGSSLGLNASTIICEHMFLHDSPFLNN